MYWSTRLTVLTLCLILMSANEGRLMAQNKVAPNKSVQKKAKADSDPFARAPKTSRDSDPFASQKQETNPFNNAARDPFSPQQNQRFRSDQPFGKRPSTSQRFGNPQLVKPSKRANDSDMISKSLVDKLQSNVRLEFQDTPFADVKETLESDFKLNVFLHFSAKDDSLDPDTLVTFRSADITFEKTLELMLEDFNADFVVDGELIKIISRDEAGNAEFFGRKTLNVRKLLKATVQNRMNSYANAAEKPKQWEIEMIAEEDLVNLIRSTVFTDSWRENGGQGSITAIDGLLVVTNHRRCLRDVQALLAELQSNIDVDRQ